MRQVVIIKKGKWAECIDPLVEIINSKKNLIGFKNAFGCTYFYPKGTEFEILECDFGDDGYTYKDEKRAKELGLL